MPESKPAGERLGAIGDTPSAAPDAAGDVGATPPAGEAADAAINPAAKAEGGPPPAASAMSEAPSGAVAPTPAAPPWVWRGLLPAAIVLASLSAGALMLAYTSQQRLERVEAELVRRQQEATQAAGDARLLSRQAETSAREVVAKMALLESRLAETTMQRSQLEDLLQSLARSRDENVLADIDAALRVAQQQSAITGSAEPLAQVLRQAEERLARYAQPRLERVRRAVAQDLERIRAAGSPDLSLLATRLDEVMRQVDELPLLVLPSQVAPRRGGVAGVPAPGGAASAAGAAGAAGAAAAVTAPAAEPARASAAAVAASVPEGSGWSALDTLRQAWNRLATHAWSEARSLLRVTRIDDPQAMLIAPEQAYFLRENVKLRLLNARLALLSRQFDVAQSDLRESLASLERYFDRSARRTVLAIDGLRQVMAQARTVVLPRPDATLAAIAAASAGR